MSDHVQREPPATDQLQPRTRARLLTKRSPLLLSVKRAMSGQAAAVRKFWAEDGNPDKMIVGQVDGQGAGVALIGYTRIGTLDL